MSKKGLKLGVLLLPVIFLVVGITNMFGIFDLTDIGQAILVAVGTLTLVPVVVSMIPIEISKEISGLITGILTVLVGATSFFGLMSIGAAAQGIIIGMGMIATLIALGILLKLQKK